MREVFAGRTLVCSNVSQLVLYSCEMRTDNLPEERASWSKWAEFLRDWRLDGLVSWALEAAGPLTVLGAQALYLGSPLLRPVFSNGQLGALVSLLEENSEAQAFIAFLREVRPA
jgi:hypothetical protein